MAKLEQTEIQLLQEINHKLNTLIGLNAIQGKHKTEQVKILASLGFTNMEISKLIGIPKGTVDSIRAKNK